MMPDLNASVPGSIEVNPITLPVVFGVTLKWCGDHRLPTLYRGTRDGIVIESRHDENGAFRDFTLTYTVGYDYEKCRVAVRIPWDQIESHAGDMWECISRDLREQADRELDKRKRGVGGIIPELHAICSDWRRQWNSRPTRMTVTPDFHRTLCTDDNAYPRISVAAPGTEAIIGITIEVKHDQTLPYILHAV